MSLFKAFTAVLAAAGLLAQTATAHSTHRNPISSLSRVESPYILTPSHRVHSHSSFDLSFLLHGRSQKVRLSLEPNNDVISEDATVRILGSDGSVRRVEAIDRSEHRIFKGTAFVQLDGEPEWTYAGWARISMQQDGSKPIFEGAFTIDGDHHHLQTDTNFRATMRPGDPEVKQEAAEYMIVWRDSDVIENRHDELKRDLGDGPGCTAHELAFNMDERNLVYRSPEPEMTKWSMSPMQLFGRQAVDGTAGGAGAGVNLANSIGSTAGCPTTRKVALVGIATDCTYTAQFSSVAAARQNIIQQVSAASQLYESSFNISLGIQNLTISEASCPGTPPASAPWNRPCSGDTDITARLNLFSKWRGQWQDNNAYWTLLTTCNTGSAVGLAWLGQVCVKGSSQANNNGADSIAGANVVVRTTAEWLVFAHETGHTFGAVHDCDSRTCNDDTVTKQQCCPLSRNGCDASGRFIMNPSTGSGITRFSPCSIGNICSFLGRYSSRVVCLANNNNVPTITGQQCGNGIVEQGEDCDCGGDEACAGNPCCNPKTCKFTTGSVCDFSNEECCTNQCQFKSAGTVCRASSGVCDPEETCSGSSSACPLDTKADDGTKCGGSGSNLECASGQCTSRDQQCRTLMGSFTTNNDTYSCSQQGCVLSCASPQFGRGICYTMQQYFLDGTPCEGGGKCSNGNCQGSNLGKQITGFFEENKKIIIPVLAIVGGLIVICIVSCLFSGCRRRRRVAAVKPRPNQPTTHPWNNYGPLPMGGPGAGGNHPQYPMAAPPPYPGAGQQMAGQPPMQQQQQQQQQNGPWEPMRTRSFRYA